ncbi:glycosyltransferase [Francisella philomiragia]|uniref:Glycosyl transferase, group 1 n=1 Tax=Francisella philomiragia subsp. philomiragia (strain ATCC 25017 / CCUG 19701 / FSC 153 / O\|nr:rhamnan synthesis F family protein [Francisella philomiragia]AJI47614.1 glycosyl transferases group 1 family protein [Francisella philomiragia]AJI50032.1 glycosyl transferases group 1 family protein [Francisella philomiragia]MBK2020726.1 glycosyltransferase [Francisella philomiragia]MBK2030854.1 glycosyltransferase [Francisella philomiragia]MBK2263488.1 glycosyltransferase [Francisella philomiragia]
MIRKVILYLFPLGARRREFISKIYRKIKPRSEQEIIKNSLFKGGKSYIDSRETIVLVSHQSSATGAPLLGLNIGKNLSGKYNLINYVMEKSTIHDAFLDDCFLLVDATNINTDLTVPRIFDYLNNKYHLKVVICNSVVTHSVLSVVRDLRIPALSLIHEFTGYRVSSEITLKTIEIADRVILPAKIVQDSLTDYLKDVEIISNIPKNILIYPQGKLPFIPKTYGDADNVGQILQKIDIRNKDEYKIIVGAGSIDIRKGIDLFISIARYTKQNYKGKCKFVWVGDGLRESDYAYSYWLQREIKIFDLSNDFIFLEHQQSLDTIFSIADIYCLTSRMDPFPNIAIDALEANLPIACFKDASGTVEFLEKYNAESIIVDYLDTYQLGHEIANYLTKITNKTNINAKLVKEYLDFDKYINFLLEKIDECCEYNTENQKISNKLEESEFFDNKFIGLSELKSASTYFYTLAHRKGLHRLTSNPCPGFSNLKWIIENGDSETGVPLYDALNKGIYTTHECYRLPINSEKNISHKFAIHLHLFYIDLADEFNEYFKLLPKGYDLYITIIDSNNSEFIKEKFSSSGAANVEIVAVDNIGRDIAPMIFGLKDQLLNRGYEIVGHFHSKKTVSAHDNLGDKWRAYLLNNLIGDNEQISNSILNLFNDEKIGLVFPEDRTYIDIGENKFYVDELCTAIGLEKICETPLFPLGNMFWARVDAIRDIFSLNEDMILQEEPLPRDGSYMHALERIIPNIVEKNGYKYVTVYKDRTSW